MRYFCCDERRRAAVRATTVYNGIEFLEVIDIDAVNPALRQRVLHVYFLKPPDPPLDAITHNDVHIEGGERVTGITVEDVTWDGVVLQVRVDRPGDYSIYTLRLGGPDGGVLHGVDPMLSSVEFSFKIECPTDFDCQDDRICPPDLLDEPEIDYLARDYASFRQLMLDRMSILVPDWQERNAADLGIALVEVLAYTADHLSYELDAIGMEATLTTAQRRSSVRRHARLVDYTMHDGANARTWVHLSTSAGAIQIPRGTPLLTQVPGVGPQIAPESDQERRALELRPAIFETMHTANLHQELNNLNFYAWGERECCLPAGSTSATLEGHFDHLDRGTVLMFIETTDPRTGSTADADPAHRHVVRLTRATPTADPIGSWFSAPDQPIVPVNVTEIEWDGDDALPFPLCISAVDREGEYHPHISIARGNMVLADHGQTISHDLPEVPKHDHRLAVAPVGSGGHCDLAEQIPAPPRYTPKLDEAPLTMAGTTGRMRFDDDERRWERFNATGPASTALVWEQRHVLPDIYLQEALSERRWFPRRDLLASGRFEPEFVAEIDPDGRARLRFGDDEYGMRPAAETAFTVTYRVGNGPAGNIGADSLHHIIFSDSRITGVSNPLPAVGGLAPERIEQVRQGAPNAFWTQKRAVTPEDYAEVTMRHHLVQSAAATERYTGSWYTIFLTIDRKGGLPVDADFESSIRDHLERFRMAGVDVEIDRPQFVSLEVELRVCILPDYYRGDVRRELLDVLGSGMRTNGERGLFHPDRFTFNQPVYLSRMYAAARDVPGVRFVEALTFKRYDEKKSSAINTGELTIGRLEIARLDNNPSFPERGVLRLNLEGGR